MNIKRISPLVFDYNRWNGFEFTILWLEIAFNTFGIEGALFGIRFSKTHFNIDFLYFTFEIKSPFIK